VQRTATMSCDPLGDDGRTGVLAMHCHDQHERSHRSGPSLVQQQLEPGFVCAVDIFDDYEERPALQHVVKCQEEDLKELLWLSCAAALIRCPPGRRGVVEQRN
jgi:hypothetical protein